ncbi:MAG: hypothetical protein CSB55_00020 [Candidatus Cloacimonadota bacterium]|nr:MAG: hypothetical protein CSB55_00020 [Candidatus Cloacimonadota bacterium]
MCKKTLLFILLICLNLAAKDINNDEIYNDFSDNSTKYKESINVSYNEETLNSGNEFEGFEEEFSDIDEWANEENYASAKETESVLGFTLWIMFAVIIASVSVRFRFTRRLKPLFLLSSLIYLGFIRGGYPCMITSFIDMILAVFGVKCHWSNFVWFLGLIPLTYLFGRVWCGWLCHFGALQEFLFLGNRFPFLKSKIIQKILKISQISLLAILLIQLFVTKRNLFDETDPFVSSFNLMINSQISLILFILLMSSSALIYRPFCRGACPVGLILGLISKIPGASIIDKDNNCLGCTLCEDTCKIEAISRYKPESKKNYETVFNHAECNACGDCFNLCKKSSVKFKRLSIKNKTAE